MKLNMTTMCQGRRNSTKERLWYRAAIPKELSNPSHRMWRENAVVNGGLEKCENLWNVTIENWRKSAGKLCNVSGNFQPNIDVSIRRYLTLYLHTNRIVNYS